MLRKLRQGIAFRNPLQKRMPDQAARRARPTCARRLLLAEVARRARDMVGIEERLLERFFAGLALRELRVFDFVRGMICPSLSLISAAKLCKRDTKIWTCLAPQK